MARFTNEPRDYTSITSIPCAEKLPYDDGWDDDDNSGGGNLTLGTDASRGLSPPSYWRITYPAGFGGGNSPISLSRYLDRTHAQTFVGVAFRVSDNFQGHTSSTNKVWFAWSSGSPNTFFSLEGSRGGDLKPTMRLQNGVDDEYYRQNVGTGAVVTRGQWHTFEALMESDTGLLRFWFDGIQIGEYSSRNGQSLTYSGAWEMAQIAPVWGGTGGRLANAQTLDIEHFTASAPGSMNERLDREIMAADVRTPPDYTGNEAALRSVVARLEADDGRILIIHDAAGAITTDLTQAQLIRLRTRVNSTHSDEQTIEVPAEQRIDPDDPATTYYITDPKDCLARAMLDAKRWGVR